jgi:hypothetical protein
MGFVASPPDYAALERADLRHPLLPAHHEFALIRRPDSGRERALAFATLADLAHSLHRAREGRPVELADALLPLRCEREPRAGVSVWTLCPGGERDRYLGFAYLRGQGREALQVALAAEKPSVDA